MTKIRSKDSKPRSKTPELRKHSHSMTQIETKSKNLNLSDIDVEKPDEKVVMTYVSEFVPLIKTNVPVNASADTSQNTSMDSTPLEAVQTLLSEMIEKLEAVIKSKMFEAENFTTYTQLKDSVLSTIKPMLEDLMLENDHLSELQPVMADYEHVNELLLSWRDSIEDSLPEKLKPLVKLLRKFEAKKSFQGELSTIEQTIKSYFSTKKTARFHGINLPAEMWKTLDERVKALQEHLPGMKKDLELNAAKSDLDKAINQAEESLKHWSVPAESYEHAKKLNFHYQEHHQKLIEKLKSTDEHYQNLLATDTNNSQVSRSITSGLQLEISSVGSLLTEILKNYEILRSSVSLLENYNESKEPLSKSRFKQICSDIKKSTLFLTQTTSDTSKLESKYLKLKQSLIPQIDAAIRKEEERRQSEKRKNNQKNLENILRNWCITVDRHLREPLVTQAQLEKLSKDFSIHVEPYFNKIQNDEKIARTKMVYEKLKRNISQMDISRKEQAFIESLKSELNGLNYNDDNIVETLEYLQLSIISALEKISDKQAIPVLNEAKSLEQSLICRIEKKSEYESSKTVYQNLIDQIHKNTEITITEQQLQAAFVRYLSALEKKDQPAAKFQHDQYLAKFREKLRIYAVGEIFTKLKKNLDLLETKHLPEYENILVKNVINVDRLKKLDAILANTDLLPDQKKAIDMSFEAVNSLASEYLETGGTPGKIEKIKTLKNKFHELKTKGENRREEFAGLKLKLDEVNTNFKKVEIFILDECEPVLRKPLDISLDLDGYLDEFGGLKKKLLITEEQSNLSEKIDRLLIDFPKIKELRYRKEDIQTLDKQLAHTKERLASSISKVKDLKKTKKVKALISSIQKYLENPLSSLDLKLCEKFLHELSSPDFKIYSEAASARKSLQDTIKKMKEQILTDFELKSDLENLQDKLESVHIPTIGPTTNIVGIKANIALLNQCKASTHNRSSRPFLIISNFFRSKFKRLMSL